MSDSSQQNIRISQADFLLGSNVDHDLLKQFEKNMNQHQLNIYQNNLRLFRNSLTKQYIKSEDLFNQKYFDRSFIVKMYQKTRRFGQFNKPSNNINIQQVQQAKNLQKGLNMNFPEQQQKWMILYKQRLYQLPDKGDLKYLRFKKNELIQLDFTYQDKIFIQANARKVTNNYKFIRQKIIDFNRKYQGAIKERFPSFTNREKELKRIYKFHNTLQQKVDDVLYDWKTKEADFRICISCSKLNHEDYYFYNKMQEVTINDGLSGTEDIQIRIAKENQFTQNNQSRYLPQIDKSIIKEIQKLKDIILLNLISSRNSAVLQKRFEPMVRKLQIAQKDKILDALNEMSTQKNEKIQKFKSENAFYTYNQVNVKSFFNKWKKQASSSPETQNSLCISMQKMYLNKSLRYKQIQCFVQLEDLKSYKKNNNNSMSRQQGNRSSWLKLMFSYKSQQTSELIYQLSRQEKQRTKWISLGNLKSAVIKIKVVGRQNDIGSKTVNLTGIQNLILQEKDNKFGDLKQINLYEDDSNNDSQGIIEALIKIISHKKGRKVKNFDLQAFRNIKLLKNIGTLPPNYISSTNLDYSPQNFNLVAELVGNTQATFSKLQYQKNYLHLVFFLQKSFNQAKRAISRNRSSNNKSITTKKKSRHFDQRTFFSIDQRFIIYKNILSDLLSVPNIFQGKQFIRKQELINTQNIKIDPNVGKSIKYSMQLMNPSDKQKVQRLVNRLVKYSIEYTTPFQKDVTFHPYLIPIFDRLLTLYKYKSISSGSSVRSSIYAQQNFQFTLINEQEVYKFSFSFLQALYPYFNPKSLQKELIAIRLLVQKYLPQFNFRLNRQNIGLQNLCSKYLLSFFAHDLQQEITYRIWDFLLICPDHKKGRLVVLYTLLIFLQTTNLLPIIPHFQFSSSLYKNYQKLKLNAQFFQTVNQSFQSLEFINQKQSRRKKQILSLKQNKNESRNIWNEYFVKKIVFSSNLNGNARQNNYIKQLNNINTTQNFVYKLPCPNYSGYKVLEIKILLRSLYILQTIAFSNKTYLVLKWDMNQSKKFLLKQKNQILNFYVKFQNQEFDSSEKPLLSPIQFLIIQEDQKYPIFLGELKIQTLHKDFLYNEQVRLIYFRKGVFNLSNKGENVLNVGIILKSQKNIPKEQKFNNTKNNLNNNNSLKNSTVSSNARNVVNDMQYQKQYYANEQKRKELMYDRFLDYDITQDANDAIRQMKNLTKFFQAMKNPLDQFGSSMKNIRIPMVSQNFSEFILNSALSIQELKAVFSQQFSQNPEYQLYLSPLYKIFSKSTNYQLVFLSEILIEILLLDQNVTLQQKLMYLFCIGKHYQNCGGKGRGLTTQTADSLVQMIFTRYGFINSVPYFSQNKGKIISGILYTHGQKVSQQGKDITNILKDWAHICKIKYGYQGLVLGAEKHLHILRSLLPDRTLQMLLNTQFCRIQITYQHHNKSIYLWSAMVSTQEFKIVKFGTKFLSNYPNQRPLSTQKVLIHDINCPNLKIITQKQQERCKNIVQCDIDTGCQLLYNAQNIINLEYSTTMSFDQFRMAVYKSPLLCYLLSYSSNLQSVSARPKAIKNNNQNGSPNKNMRSPTSKLQSMKRNNSQENSTMNKFGVNNQYNDIGNMTSSEDLALYRYQNCIQRWRNCNIVSTQSVLSLVKFADQQKNLPIQLAKNYNKRLQDQFLYKIPKFQVFEMDQNLVGIQEQESANRRQSQTVSRNLREELIAMSPAKKRSVY